MKFKIGDKVVRKRGIQRVTLYSYPIGHICKILKQGGIRHAEWGMSYYIENSAGFVISDCDYELFRPRSLENK